MVAQREILKIKAKKRATKKSPSFFNRFSYNISITGSESLTSGISFKFGSSIG